MIISFIQKLSTWVTLKSNISTRIDFLLLTSVTFLRAVTMRSAFTPDCGYDNSTVILIGNVYCLNTNFSGKLCPHEKTFQPLGRSNYQWPRCGYVCLVCNIPFEDQTNPFFLSFGQGVYIFEESPKSIQDVVGDVCCPGNYSFNREKCEPLNGYITAPRPITVFGKCGAWLFVHKGLFILQEHVKTTTTDKTRFFFARKGRTC